MVFRVSLVRKLLGVPDVSRRQLRHLHDFGLEVGPAETSRKFSFVFLGNALVPEPSDIQLNSVGWRHLTRLEPYFRGSHEKSVFGPGKLGAPKDPAVLDKSPATAWSITFFAPPVLEYQVQRCMSGL